MTALEIAQPDSIEEACRLLEESRGEAKIIAGGTAVVLMMRQGLIAPYLLVSLHRIAGHSSIELVDTEVRIGANVTLEEVASSEVVRAGAPSLARACATVGNVLVRNAATLVGTLAEADYASDPPAVLSCLGATCIARGSDGDREIPIADLITGFYSTVLAPAEVITEIRVPQIRDHERASYLKYVSRSSEDRPCVGVATRAGIRNGVLEDVNVVVGAVAPSPVSIPEVCDRAFVIADGEVLAVG